MSFESEYREMRPELENAAKHLEEYVAVALQEQRILFHGVTVRAKAVESALRKVQKKKYQDPLSEIMDLLGARVFTYFRSDAEEVERVLRQHFRIIEAHCSNKQNDLAYNTFGYTSRHLVCEVGNELQDLRLKSALPKGVKIEFQIRSVLEHAWAEVEHELVYKAGTKPPTPIQRRFAATAAALELVENEFADLRGFELELANSRLTTIRTHLDHELDRAWFVAVLNETYPERESWNSDPTKDVFYHGNEVLLLEALRLQGVATVGDFRARVRDRKTGRLVEYYARRRRLNVGEVSHLPIAIFATFLNGDEGLVSSLEGILDASIKDLLRDRWSRANRKAGRI